MKNLHLVGLLISCIQILGNDAGARTYTTDFPLTENPISEDGNWINGGTVGLDWTNVATTSGLAHGTQNGLGVGLGRYNDSTALLSGAWGSNQTVQATVHVGTRPASGIEVELRLRSSLSVTNCTGYECNFSMAGDADGPYAQIVRWKGPLGKFQLLNSISIPQLNEGDVVKAVASGNTITTYVNGTALFSVTDDTFTNGSPGIGFYLQGDGTNDSGFTSFTATDGIGGSMVLATTENTTVTVSSNKLVKVASTANGDALSIYSLDSTSSAGGTVVFDDEANVVYTPSNNFTGPDSFTYVVSDPFGEEPANTVNVTVSALNVSGQITANDITPFPDGTMQIIASGFPGTNYWIQATTNVGLTPWATIGTNAALANGLILFTDLDAPNYLMRFYRLAVPTNN